MNAAENITLDDADALRAALEDIAQTKDVAALIDLVLKLLLNLSNENKRMALRLQKTLHQLHGRRSEKLSPDQLDLFKELLFNERTSIEQSTADNQNGSDLEPPAPKKSKKKSPTPHGRSQFPASLPRVEHIIAVPDDERACKICGATKQCMGHAVSERLDYVPAVISVVQEKREKLACKPCQGSISIAPAAPHLIEKGLVTEGLLAHVVVSKYIDGLTLTRLTKIYARSGVHIAESTLGDFVRQAAMHLQCVAKHIEKKVLEAYCINQDDTGLRVLDREHPNGCKRGHIWAYAGGPYVTYRYTPDWKGKHPKEFLVAYKGFVQGDGYTGIDGLFVNSDPAQAPTRVGCMMHCRRYFFDAHKAGDLAAGIPLALISQIYEIEAAAKEDSMTSDQRTELRQQRSLPLMNDLFRYIETVKMRTLPKSDLGKAITYATNQWTHLLVPFSDGRLEIDNGEAERRLKMVAIGRKNWLFAGSDAGGERAATLLTVLGTAVWQGVDPLAYLTAIFAKIAAGISAGSVAQLLPLAWADQSGQQISAQKTVLPRLIV